MADFVTEYQHWTSNMTDAPRFHQILAALVALATAIGPVKVPFKPQTILPNLFINILGRTFLDRKTKGTYACLKQVVPQQLLLDLTDFSSQSIQTKIQEHGGEGLLPIDEYGMFLRDCRKKDFMSGTKRLLMKFYDCTPLIKGTYSNPVKIPEPYVNVITFSTRQTFLDNIEKYDITSGFVGRQIHGYAERPKGKYRHPEPMTKEDRERLLHLRKSLQDLSKNRKENAVFGGKALELLKDYKRKIDDECMERDDDNYSAVAGRYGGDYSVKFSILFQFSIEDPLKLPLQVTIEEDAVKRAIKLTDLCIQCAMQEVVFYKSANQIERTYRWIMNLSDESEDGFVRRSDLHHKLNIYKDDLDRIISTLEDRGDIIVEKIEPTAKGGRRGEKYKPVRERRKKAREFLKQGSLTPNAELTGSGGL